MTLRRLTRTVSALLGVCYVLVGVGSIALPAGWISPRWAGDDVAALYAAATPESFLNHLTQEFGTLVIAVGFVFLWQARREEPSRNLHWLLTLYLALDSAIHWVGPQGLVGSLQRGLINSIPPLVMLILGILSWRALPRRDLASASERSQRTFITMKVRSSYCSASRIQSFISSESRALISSAGR